MDDLSGSNAPHLDLAAALEPEALRAWLEYQFAAHQARVNDLTKGFKAFDKATANGIHDEDIAKRTTTLIIQIKAEARAIDSTRTRIKAPVLNASREIDGYARTFATPLDGQAKVAEARLTAFHVAKERAEREARERAAHEAEERAAALAQEHSPDASEAFEEAGKAMEAAAAPPADVTRLHTPTGGVSSLKVRYIGEIVDIAKVPRPFLLVNEALVQVAIREAPRNPDGSPNIDIPGIRIVRVESVTVR